MAPDPAELGTSGVDRPGELNAGELVFEQQMLRLNIRGEHFVYPVVAGPGGDVTSKFGLNVSNEFGLWKRSDLSYIGQTVRLTLIGHGAHDATLELLDCEPANRLEASPEGSERGVFMRWDEAARLHSSLAVRVPTRPVLLQAEVVPQGTRQVAGVCSLPIFPPACDVTAEDVKCILRNAPEARQCRAVQGHPELFVAEAPGHLGIGGKVWDAALATIEWLSAPADGCGTEGKRLDQWVRGKHLLELGSGTGVLALTLGTLSSPLSVTMTDLAEVVPLLEMNVALNRVVGCLQTQDAKAGCGFHCAPLRWGDKEDVQRLWESGTVPDTLLCSDTVYDPACYAPLVESLVALCPPELHGRQRVLLVYRHRHSASSFFSMMEEHFEVTLLPGLAVDGTLGADLSLQDLQFFSCARRPGQAGESPP